MGKPHFWKKFFCLSLPVHFEEVLGFINNQHNKNGDSVNCSTIQEYISSFKWDKIIEASQIFDNDTNQINFNEF